METANKNCEAITTEGKTTPLSIFVDGAGCRPDGSGSAFAWLCTTTKEQAIERISGLTNNQAEYRAFIAALTALPERSQAELFSDSQVLCCQLSGQYKVNDLQLAELLTQAQSLIKDKKLTVTLRWVPRARNLAGKLL